MMFSCITVCFLKLMDKNYCFKNRFDIWVDKITGFILKFWLKQECRPQLGEVWHGQIPHLIQILALSTIFSKQDRTQSML